MGFIMSFLGLLLGTTLVSNCIRRSSLKRGLRDGFFAFLAALVVMLAGALLIRWIEI